MKNRWNLLWNPFSRIAGWQAFGLGIVIAILAAVLGAYGNLAFDGAIDAHFSDELSPAKSLLLLLIDLVSLWIFLLLGAWFLKRPFRVQDILGTTTLARFPMLLLAAVAVFSTTPELDELLANPLVILQYPSFLLFIIVSVPLMVWMIALLYHAFRVSVGGKGPKMVWTFILALLLAEIASKILIYALL